MTTLEMILTFALILAGCYSAVISHLHFRSQKPLNDLQLTKGYAEIQDEARADLSAKLISKGNRKYRVKVFNKGKASAVNVRIVIPEDTNLIQESDVREKFPLEILEPHSSVEILAIVYIGTRPKQMITLIWDDITENDKRKDVFLTT